MIDSYKAAVIGLGRIGSSYPSKNIPRTHAETYLKNNRIKLVAAVDPDQRAREDFSEKWGHDIPVYENIEQMLSNTKPDIVSICLSPSPLLEAIKSFTGNEPGLFFLEKPVIDNADDKLLLNETLKNIPVAVNYHRCWDPSHVNFFNEVLASGKIISIRAIYGKGLLNYASHLIALLMQYFGKISDVKKLPLNTHDSEAEDPSFSFIIKFESGVPAVIQGFDNLPFDLLEMEIMTTGGLYSIKSAGCRKRIETPENNVFYPDYIQLVDGPILMPDAEVQGLEQAIENIVLFLDGETEHLSCDLSHALDVFDVIWQIKQTCNS